MSAPFTAASHFTASRRCMHLLVVALLAAAPDGGTQLKLNKRARETLLAHASKDLSCPVAQLKIKGRDLQGDVEVSGCDREEGYSLLGGKWLSLMQSLLNLDVATVVGGLNRSEGSTAFIEPEAVEAVCSFPKILQGLGYLHVKFKRSPEAVTKASSRACRSLRAERLPSAPRKKSLLN